MNKLGKIVVALAMFSSLGAADAVPLINIPEGATQAEIVQALADVDEGGTVTLAVGTYMASARVGWTTRKTSSAIPAFSTARLQSAATPAVRAVCRYS